MLLWEFSEHLVKQGTIFDSEGYKKSSNFIWEESEKLNNKIVVMITIINNSKLYWAFIMFKILGKQYIKLYEFSPLIFTRSHFTDEENEIQRSLKNLPKSPIWNRIE